MAYIPAARRESGSQQEICTGSFGWSYEDGKLTPSFEGAALKELSAVETLALINLLYSNYKEIAKKAQEEQRKYEHSYHQRKDKTWSM